MPSALVSVKSDRPRRLGPCSCRKMTSCSGPASARQARMRRSSVRRMPGPISGWRRRISPRTAIAGLERPRNGPEWVHEVEHDGYRLMVRRAGARVRLFTRRGYDWTERYPRIAQAMAGLKIASATIDGEAVIWGPEGADFDKLHS